MKSFVVGLVTAYKIKTPSQKKYFKNEHFFEQYEFLLSCIVAVVKYGIPKDTTTFIPTTTFQLDQGL